MVAMNDLAYQTACTRLGLQSWLGTAQLLFRMPTTTQIKGTATNANVVSNWGQRLRRSLAGVAVVYIVTVYSSRDRVMGNPQFPNVLAVEWVLDCTVKAVADVHAHGVRE